MKYKFEDIAINSTAKKLPEPSDNEHYIGLEHLDSGNLYVTRWGADTAPLGEKLLMKKGDVLFGKRRAYQKKVCIAPFDGIFSAHGMVLRPKEDVICKEFFPFFISSDYFLNEAIRISVGGLSPTINWKDLRVLEFELPSLEEQRVLADKLWAAYEVKESYKNLLAQTDKLLHAQFQKMFGKETNIKSWKDVLTIRNGKAYPKEYLEEGPYPIYGSGGVMGYAEDYLFDEDTIIVGRKGNINNPILVREKYWTVDTAFCLDIDKKILNPIYFYNWCQQFDFTYFNKQGVLPSLTRTDLYTIKMPVPPMEKQLEFVRIAEQAERTKASLNKGIEAIEAVIRSLIAEGTTRV